MKVVFKFLKWILITIATMLLLVVIIGLGFRLFSAPSQPPGEMVDVGGFEMFVSAKGEKNDKPTLIIESGAGAPSEYYHWLGEGLKDSLRVVRYDRAGIGYSERSNNASRHPRTIAKELHFLLEKSGESPPYILAGHSYGGHFIRVFKEMYPDEVVGLVFLDSPHPDESQRLNMPKSPKWLDAMYVIGGYAGDLGVLNLMKYFLGRPLLWAPGLPDEVNDSFNDFTKNGEYLWGYIEEDKWYSELRDLSRKAMVNDTIPVRVFSGTRVNETIALKMGLDPKFIKSERATMQKEMSSLSSNGKTIFLDGGHITIFSEKENADLICAEILDFVKGI